MEGAAIGSAITKKVHGHTPRHLAFESHADSDRDDEPAAERSTPTENPTRHIDHVHHPTLAVIGATYFPCDIGKDRRERSSPRNHVSHTTVAIENIIVWLERGDRCGL